jgi:hypothetical protein
MRYGAAGHDRLLYCRTCQARFSEHKGTPLFRARLLTEKTVAVLQYLAEGCGIRQTSRLVGVRRHKAPATGPALIADEAEAVQDWGRIGGATRVQVRCKAFAIKARASVG